MFHFFHSQGGAKKYLLTGLLGLVALSMLLYLVPNYNDGTTGTDGATVLQVGDTKWTSLDTERRYQAYAKGRLPDTMLAVYFPQFLEESKQRLAAIEEARRLGLVPSDAEIFEVIATTPGFNQFFENGKLVKRAEFEAALGAQGFTIQDVYDDIRDQLSLVRMQDTIVDSTVVTDKEVQAEYKKKHDRITIDWVAFSEAELGPKVKVTDAEVQAAYDKNKGAYTQPEKRSYRAVILSKDKVEAGMTLSEQEVRAAYSAALDNFRTPEKIHARHILVSTEGKSDADKTKAKEKADGLLKQLRGGADFAELAKKNSDDTGNASSGGDLGTFPRGTMVKPFEDAAFALKPNEISNVVNTQYGYHIVQVLEKEPSTVTPFENVKADIERDLRANRAIDALGDAATKLRTEVLKNPANAADAARAANADVITMTDAIAGQPLPTGGPTPEIDAALVSLKPGVVSDVIPLSENRAAIVILDKRTPARPSTFDEAREGIRETLLKTGAARLLDTSSKEAVERLKKGEDIQSVAKSLGGKVESASDFALPDSAPGIGQGAAIMEVFKHKAGEVVGPLPIQGRTLVFKILSKTDADMSGLTAERSEIVNNLRTARAAQQNRLWMDSIVKKMTDSGDIVVNEEEMQRIVGRLGA